MNRSADLHGDVPADLSDCVAQFLGAIGFSMWALGLSTALLPGGDGPLFPCESGTRVIDKYEQPYHQPATVART
eukprot:11161824-Lingulodinium_polyedra.AAC.1